MTSAARSRSAAAGSGLALAGAAGAFGSLDTALNIAFPDLVADFDLSVGQLQWVVVCFVAASGGLLVVAGRLGDRVGHAPVALGGALASVVAMVACAVAPTFGWFLGARVAQGVGTAALMASAPALATAALPPDARTRAVGLFQAAAASGLAAGPVVGGAMVVIAGWRGVFWFRVPLALAVAVLAWRAAGLKRPPEGRGRPSVVRAAPPADAGSWRALGRPGAVVANGLTIVVNGAMFVTWLLVPSLLVDELGVGVIAGGIVLALSPVATAAGARAAPSVVARLGSGVVQAGGIVLVAAGLGIGVAVGRAVDSGADPGGGVAVAALVVVSLVVVGAGLGLFSVPNMATVIDVVGAGREGVAGAANLMARTVGIVAGASWHAAVVDRYEPSLGFGGAYAAAFGVAAGLVAGAGVVAAVTGARPSGARSATRSAAPTTRR